MPSAVEYLPPHSYIIRQDLNISKAVPALIALPVNTAIEKFKNDQYTVGIKFKRADYDSASAPFKFKLFLTFDAGNGQEFYTRHFFYVTEVKQTDGAGLQQVLISSDGDKFYCRLIQ